MLPFLISIIVEIKILNASSEGDLIRMRMDSHCVCLRIGTESAGPDRSVKCMVIFYSHFVWFQSKLQ